MYYIYTHYRKKDSLQKKKTIEVSTIHSVPCEAVVNPRALSSIRNPHNLRVWKMLQVKESFKARNGNRESRRGESSRARDLSPSRSLKTLRKV